MLLNLDTLPTRRDEAWKWTDVRGRVEAVEPKGLEHKGVCLLRVPDGLKVQLGESISSNEQPMSILAKQHNYERYIIDVPAGFRSDVPIEIDEIRLGHVLVKIRLGKNAVVNLVENFYGEENGFSNYDIMINLQQGAKLNRVIVHEDPISHIRNVTSHITAWANTSYIQHSLSFGGSLSRLETRLAGMGKNIDAVINGAYLLRDNHHCNMTSYIDLAVPDRTIRQAVKGVVTDKARGVFQGKFHVRKPAQHTDAEMRHDALMLSDSCEIRSKPELEIYADDVACAHGNTIGQLDENALFYMRQRGIPAAEARALLTEAFVADVFDDMADEALKDSLLGKIRDWLKETK